MNIYCLFFTVKTNLIGGKEISQIKQFTINVFPKSFNWVLERYEKTNMPFGMSAIIVIFQTSFGNQRKLRNKIKIRSVQSHLNDPKLPPSFDV